MSVSVRGSYVFTFAVRKRSRPNPKYEGILRTHRFYIEYYGLLEGQEPTEVVGNHNPRIAFPVSLIEVIVDFARELGGSIVEVRKIKIPNMDVYYERPVILLPNEVAFRRHLLFALTLSTYRKVSEARFNAIKNLLLSMNATFLNILTSIALDRYNELRASQNPAWHWYMLRVGRALKVLYKLD